MYMYKKLCHRFFLILSNEMVDFVHVHNYAQQVCKYKMYEDGTSVCLSIIAFQSCVYNMYEMERYPDLYQIKCLVQIHTCKACAVTVMQKNVAENSCRKVSSFFKRRVSILALHIYVYRLIALPV